MNIRFEDCVKSSSFSKVEERFQVIFSKSKNLVSIFFIFSVILLFSFLAEAFLGLVICRLESCLNVLGHTVGNKVLAGGVSVCSSSKGWW